jgi:hypothetical protein
MRVSGEVKVILDKIVGEKKDGSGNWEKQSFIVETTEKYNNIYCFEMFGADKVSILNSDYAVGNHIVVDFNVSTNEYKGKYYTTLQAWKISSDESNETNLYQ